MKRFLVFILALSIFVGFSVAREVYGSFPCPPRTKGRPPTGEWEEKQKKITDSLSSLSKECDTRLVGTGQVRVVPPKTVIEKLNLALFQANRKEGPEELIEIVLWREKGGKSYPLWRKIFLKGSPIHSSCMPSSQKTFRMVLMDLNRDKKPDLVLEGNESYCTSFALFLNQGGFHSFSPDNFISVYTTSEDERFLLDLDQDGNKELLVRAGLFGRVGAAEIPMGCDEILDKTDAAVREEFLKRVEEPYLDEKGNKPKWVPVAFLPTEKIKILGFDPKNKMKLVDQTSHYQKDIQWRLGVLEKILASPESFVTDRPFTPECRKKIEGTVQYLKGLTEAGESLSKKAPN